MQSLDVVGSPLEVVSLNPTTKVLGDLPPELIREVLLRVERRVALARCSAVAMQWHALVHTEVAKEHVRTARSWIPDAHICPCWLRCCAAMATLESKLCAPLPSGQTWRTEHSALREDAAQILDVDWGGYDLSMIEHHPWVVNKILSGWNDDFATVLAGAAGMQIALGEAIREGTATRFAATLRCWLDAAFYLSVVFRKSLGHHPSQPQPKPRLVYANLLGQEGLSDWYDPAWHPKKLEALGIGGSFTTSAAADAKEPMGCNFQLSPSEDAEGDICRGWYAYTGLDAFEGSAAFEYQPSDIVCFRMYPDDRHGFHTLLYEPRVDALDSGSSVREDDLWILPPFARVTLERIDQPGEWQVELIDCDADTARPQDGGGQFRKPLQRLFTVSVSFGC